MNAAAVPTLIARTVRTVQRLLPRRPSVYASATSGTVVIAVLVV